MSKIQLTTAQFFKQLNVLFYGFLLMPFLFAPISVGLDTGGSFGNREDVFANFVIILPIILVVLVIASFWYFHSKIKVIARAEDLSMKLKAYRTVLIISLSFIEAGMVISLVVYFLTLSNFFLAYGAILSLILIYRKPRKADLPTTLALSEDEIRLLNSPDEILIKS